MKIALLSFDLNTQGTYLKGIQKTLLSMNHLATMFYHCGESSDPYHKRIGWANWNFGELLEYDRVLIMNGYAKETFAQTSFLKQFFKDRMFFCERGWLPQNPYIYIDKDGLGGRSLLSFSDLGRYGEPDYKRLSGLREYYMKDYKHQGDGYILIPLQLENDTSVVLDSPYFKTMKSLVSFVKHHFGEYQIVVRPHPLNADVKFDIPGVVVENKTKTINLAKDALAIIGINSTVMIESLIFYKPIMMFGQSVLSGTEDIMCPCSLTRPRRLLEFRPNQDSVDRALTNLCKNQFNHTNVKPTDLTSFLV